MIIELVIFFSVDTFSAAGLYYVAELVEEYTVTAKKVITILVLFVTTVDLLFIFVDNLPWSMVICGLLSQTLHAIILTDFPYVKLASVQFIGAVILLFVNHYLAFSFFTQYYFNFTEVGHCFRDSLCIWFSIFWNFNFDFYCNKPFNFISLIFNDFAANFADNFAIKIDNMFNYSLIVNNNIFIVVIKMKFMVKNLEVKSIMIFKSIFKKKGKEIDE